MFSRFLEQTLPVGLRIEMSSGTGFRCVSARLRESSRSANERRIAPLDPQPDGLKARD